MKILAQIKPGTDLMQIWIRTPGTHKNQIARVDPDGFFVFEDIDSLKEVEPTLTIDSRIWEALTAKLNGVLPPSASTERHLEDAIKVRDRLFDLVEKG